MYFIHMVMVDNDVNEVHQKFSLDMCHICLKIFPAMRCYYSNWFSFYFIYEYLDRVLNISWVLNMPGF